jgi:hypothetical protein
MEGNWPADAGRQCPKCTDTTQERSMHARERYWAIFGLRERDAEKCRRPAPCTATLSKYMYAHECYLRLGCNGTLDCDADTTEQIGTLSDLLGVWVHLACT